MTQEQLDRLWSAYVLSREEPEGYKCLRSEAGDHIIQYVPSGEQWERKREGLQWVSKPGQT